MQLIEHSDSPRYIRLHERDNVVVVVNDQGVPAGTEFPDGLVTVDFIPQSHKVTLEDIPEGGQIIRYGQTIGYALAPLDSNDPQGLIRLADAAMYAGKQGGKRSIRRNTGTLALAP